MKIYDQFDYKGITVRIQESESAKSYTFKVFVFGKIKINLGCHETENDAKAKAMEFIDKVKAGK